MTHSVVLADVQLLFVRSALCHCGYGAPWVVGPRPSSDREEVGSRDLLLAFGWVLSSGNLPDFLLAEKVHQLDSLSSAPLVSPWVLVIQARNRLLIFITCFPLLMSSVILYKASREQGNFILCTVVHVGRILTFYYSFLFKKNNNLFWKINKSYQLPLMIITQDTKWLTFCSICSWLTNLIDFLIKSNHEQNTISKILFAFRINFNAVSLFLKV